MLHTLSNFFFPTDFTGTDDEHRQAHIIINTSLLTAFFSLNYILISWAINYWQGVYIMTFNFVAVLGLPFLFKFRLASYITVGYLYIIADYPAVFLDCLYTGAYYSPIISWLVIFPTLGAFLLGRRGGIYFTLLALVSLLVLWFLEQQKVVIFNYIDLQYRLIFSLNVFAGLILILMVIALVFYSNNQRTLNLLAEKNILLSERTTQLQQSLDHLQITQKQLIQSEKMASLGELTAGIAHEIQNPLNFVNNFSSLSAELVGEIQQERKKLDRNEALEAEILDDLSGNLAKINHHGGRASSIVKNMLEHSRTNTGEKQRIDINALADEYLKLSYHGLRTKDKGFNTELRTQFDQSLDKIEVIPQDLSRVLLNLFNNAFYAVHQKKQEGGTDYHPSVLVSTFRHEGFAEIRVSDNGMGISQSVQQKIFQPFFTTKPIGEGTGLGLSLSYDIITKGHGGELLVESQEGKGAEFIIKLPI